jgi:hypothetical protein
MYNQEDVLGKGDQGQDCSIGFIIVEMPYRIPIENIRLAIITFVDNHHTVMGCTILIACFFYTHHRKNSEDQCTYSGIQQTKRN